MKSILENNTARLIVDPFGGAITSFHLKSGEINPLSFAFTNDQMPANNKFGASYQGHFACIGRWGPSSAGEIMSGVPNHGEPANIKWTIEKGSDHSVTMNVLAEKEGLLVDRTIQLDTHSPVYMVRETVMNINGLGRPYNIVQHPTLAAPFLDEHTIINCNAGQGFDQALYKDIASNTMLWPMVKDISGNLINLTNPHSFYNAVYSFVVKPMEEYGWITAFSPTHNLMIGYLWKRAHYPWIHLWQHYENDQLLYRGIEFGTAGIHQPFSEILDTATSLFGDKTYSYIDAGEKITKDYFSFIHATGNEFTGVENVYFANDQLRIKASGEAANIIIKLSQQLTSELPG